MSALSPYLLNEILHVAGASNPHTHTEHSNRSFVDVVPAPAFDGTLTNINDLPVITLTNGLSITLRGSARIPKGALSLDALQLLLVQNAGLTAAGDAVLGAVADFYEGGDNVLLSAFNTVAVAIPAENGTFAVLRRVAPTVVIPALSSTDEFVRIVVERTGAIAQDDYDDDLHFAGAYLSWTCDE